MKRSVRSKLFGLNVDLASRITDHWHELPEPWPQCEMLVPHVQFSTVQQETPSRARHSFSPTTGVVCAWEALAAIEGKTPDVEGLSSSSTVPLASESAPLI